MISIPIDLFQRNPAKYLQSVQKGGTLIITFRDKPIAEIKPTDYRENSLRPIALCRGEFTVPNDFDDPLPDSILSNFDEQ